MNQDRKKFAVILFVFLVAYYLPVNSVRVRGAFIESFAMLHEYAREHVIFCLVPAFFIAGAIAVFVSQASVMKYFGPQANKLLSYTVASVSGAILAVCSCTVLPLFAGIYTRGAGLGPAVSFLYSGPAINVLAIVLTARVLGFEMGVARAVGAIGFAFIVGLLMHLIFLKEEKAKARDLEAFDNNAVQEARPLWKTTTHVAIMIGILVFANWGRPVVESGLWAKVYMAKWVISGVLMGMLALTLLSWFEKDELRQWVSATWEFAKQILPLLFGGVLVAGFLLGRPGHEGVIPSRVVESLVGGNSLFANFFAAVSGAFMYFATLTEVPILQGLIGSGMGKGPALALLLAGPSLSLPSMLVINSILGFKKTATYVVIVVILATVAGLVYGSIR